MQSNIPKSGDYTSSLNPFVYNAVPSDSVCLDVGCWTGNLGSELIKKKRCVVDGLDADTSVLKTAKKSGYRATYNINLNNDPLHLELGKNKYDVIIYADVLEHLINPVKILVDLKKMLKSNGQIIVSLPNVGFIQNRINLLAGKWEYREFGCMDKTHLRFYTISSAVEMVKSAGYHVIMVNPYNQFGFLRQLNKINNIYPPLFAYQTLIVAKA